MKEASRPLIAVITAVACNPAQKELLAGVIGKAMEYGYDTAVISNIYNMFSKDNYLITENRIYELMNSDQITALIVDTEAFSDRNQLWRISKMLEQKNVPMILVGERLPELSGIRAYCINTDDAADVELLTDHLIDSHGFTDIDMLTGPEDNSISQMRVDGFMRSMSKHGIECGSERIRYGNFWLTSGDELAKKYISGEVRVPRAIVCANDQMAFGLLRTLKRSKIRVPQDIAVAAYELSDRRIFFPPLLTVVKRNRKEQGEQAVTLLRSILGGSPLPEFTPSIGELVIGESCSCTPDLDVYHRELENAAAKKDDEFIILFGTMEQRLTSAKNMDEFAAGVGEFHWQVRGVDNMYLCLHSDWYEKELSGSPIMNCRSVIPWANTTPFDVQRGDISAFFRREAKPSACYFSPVFFKDRYMGHMVLKYMRPDSYDNLFRNWLKSVSNGLEFLRMKNDIQYLLSCQDLSDTRDNLTGMYNKKGLKQAFRTASQGDQTQLHFIMMRVCIFDPASFTTESRHKVDALLNAAKTVRDFCGDHELCGCVGDQTFVCVVRSDADTELLCGALSASLVRNDDYMNSFGINSFCCTGMPCGDKDLDTLFSECAQRLQSEKEQLELRCSMPHYRDMLTIRNAIYAEPQRTFDPFYLDLVNINRGSIRLIYKKVFGISINQDCINARMSMAKYYLAGTTMSIMDIAEKWGYIDHKYFQRQFTAHTGITAGKYRSLLT